MRLIDADLLLSTSSGVTMIIPTNIHPHEAIKIQGNAFREAVEKAPTVDAMEVVRTRWIPVTERLPELTEEEQEAGMIFGELFFPEFLVMISGATQPTSLYYDGESWYDDSLQGYRVSHWMPMLLPPKGE